MAVAPTRCAEPDTMDAKPRVLILTWLPNGILSQLAADFPSLEFVDAREPAEFDRHFPEAAITYGVPPVPRLAEAPGLRWIQLISAGVPQDLCPVARDRGVTVTNLAGLYGPSIAADALCL